MSGPKRTAAAGAVERLRSLAVYFEPRIVSILFLGFVGGLPLMLVLRTLSAWLAETGVDKSTIGLFGFVMAPYTLKFLWAPVMDRAPLPFLTSRFGRRRGWLLLTQVALIAAIFGLGQSDPLTSLQFTALMAFLVAFCSASQDIVIDAYRIEILDESRQGAGAANYVTGYRIGMWIASAGALLLADMLGWSLAYTAMAALVVVGMVTVLLSPEPVVPDDAPAATVPDAGERGPATQGLVLAAALGALTGGLVGASYGATAGWLTGLAVALLLGVGSRLFANAPAFRQAVIDPFHDFFRRNGIRVAIVILVFISLFKASDVLLTLMANPFYIEMGFTKSQIAWVSGTFGFIVTFIGAYAAGAMIYRIGILRGLWISGVLMMASNLMFAVQALAGNHYPLLHLTILIENVSGGMGTTAFVAYLASLCNRRYTAVQYALLTSFMQMFGKFVVVPGSGYLVEWVGWIEFFVLSALAGLPALLLLVWLGRRVHDPERPRALATA